MAKKTARLGKAPKLSRRFEQAFAYALRHHNGQGRKGTGIPYMSHLMAVTALVMEAGGDEDLAIAALLHDVVEDCGGEPRMTEIQRKFGKRVAHVVDGCTDTDESPKPPWRERKERYLKHLSHGDADTRLVSTADKVHNLRSIVRDYREVGEQIWKRFNGKREGTLWYYQSLATEFRRKSPNRLTPELERALSEMETLMKAKRRD